MKAISGKQFCRFREDRGLMLKRVAGSHHIYSNTANPARISALVQGHTPLTIDLQRHQKKFADLAETMH